MIRSIFTWAHPSCPRKLKSATRTPLNHPTDRLPISAWPPVLLLILAWSQRVNRWEESATGISSTIRIRTISMPARTQGHLLACLLAVLGSPRFQPWLFLSAFPWFYPPKSISQMPFLFSQSGPSLKDEEGRKPGARRPGVFRLVVRRRPSPVQTRQQAGRRAGGW